MKSQVTLLIALLLIASSLRGGGIPLLPIKQLEAEHVTFDEKTLLLVGHVKVIHEIGTLQCDHGKLLLPQEKKGDEAIAVNTIFLNGNVIIDFTDGSRLTADEGEIDCRTLEGTFIASPPGKVTYTSFAINDRLKIPVKATGKALKAKIIKTPEGYALTSLRGEGAVNIEYQRPLPQAPNTEGRLP